MPCYSGQNHNVPAVFLAKEWKGRLDEVDLAKEDGFELGTDKVLG
jgi:hypothetical protein